MDERTWIKNNKYPIFSKIGSSLVGDPVQELHCWTRLALFFKPLPSLKKSIWKRNLKRWLWPEDLLAGRKTWQPRPCCTLHDQKPWTKAPSGGWPHYSKTQVSRAGFSNSINFSIRRRFYTTINTRYGCDSETDFAGQQAVLGQHFSLDGPYGGLTTQWVYNYDIVMLVVPSILVGAVEKDQAVSSILPLCCTGEWDTVFSEEEMKAKWSRTPLPSLAWREG